ncbi:hypothetical protein BC827DRAFT_1383084 [Russula dissimulans]|nr:hypothetical protein BC827DRAFT_1383084 [Russula dissimulans]
MTDDAKKRAGHYPPALSARFVEPLQAVTRPRRGATASRVDAAWTMYGSDGWRWAGRSTRISGRGRGRKRGRAASGTKKPMWEKTGKKQFRAGGGGCGGGDDGTVTEAFRLIGFATHTRVSLSRNRRRSLLYWRNQATPYAAHDLQQLSGEFWAADANMGLAYIIRKKHRPGETYGNMVMTRKEGEVGGKRERNMVPTPTDPRPAQTGARATPERHLSRKTGGAAPPLQRGREKFARKRPAQSIVSIMIMMTANQRENPLPARPDSRVFISPARPFSGAGRRRPTPRDHRYAVPGRLDMAIVLPLHHFRTSVMYVTLALNSPIGPCVFAHIAHSFAPTSSKCLPHLDDFAAICWPY